MTLIYAELDAVHLQIYQVQVHMLFEIQKEEKKNLDENILRVEKAGGIEAIIKIVRKHTNDANTCLKGCVALAKAITKSKNKIK